MEDYKKALAGLNSRQREAVEYIDGPLLVIAGPGTGKTQLLGVRVAYILENTDASPENILCLTFTNKAAANMQERLMTLIGATAHGVTVKTFHSFAAELMNQYPAYFWNGARLAVAPDAVQLDIIETILGRLPLDNPLALRFGGNFTATGDVQKSLQLAKEAGLTPDKLRAIIKANLAYLDIIEPSLVDITSKPLSYKRLDELRVAVSSLPQQPIDNTVAPLTSLSTVLNESLQTAIQLDTNTGKTTFTGKWKSRFVQSQAGVRGMFGERKRNNWWLELASVYEQYRHELELRQLYDYSDMLVEVIAQLEKNPDMLGDVQERFLYTLIDEFQDSNAAQIRLAQLVSNHFTQEGRPNLMVVGDDDQSIYKFNGAELNNMLSFRRMYTSTKTVVLTENYRSTQAILDTASTIIDISGDRLSRRDPSLTKDLTAKNPAGKPGKIEHRSYPSREHQYSAVGSDIAALHKTGQSVAVLARNNESLKQLAAILLEIGVPVRYEQQRNLLDHELVRHIYSMAGLVIAIQDGDEAQTNALLAEILRHPSWDIPPLLLWQLATANHTERAWLETLLNHDNDKLKNIGHLFIWLAGQSDKTSLPLMFEYLTGLQATPVGASPIKSYYSNNQRLSTSYIEALSAFQKLRSLILDYSTTGDVTLRDFVNFIQLHLANRKVIADESVFVSSPDAVQLLTVYKAKGLEFDTVYVIDAIDRTWQPRAGGRKPPANVPLQPYGDDYDDYVRLMYVAATRAKHTLLVSSFRYDQDGGDVVASPLISTTLPEVKVSRSEAGDPLTVLEQNIRWPRLEAASEQSMLAGTLESFSLSVTSLLNFLDVSRSGPQYFFERNLLRLPEAKSTSLAYGSAVHSALEFGQILTNSGRFDLGPVQNRFEQALKSEFLPENEHEKYLIAGQKTLTNLFGELGYQLPKGSLPEFACKDIRIGPAKIGGKFDRVDIRNQNELKIVDYKTGGVLKDFATKDKTKQIKAWSNKTQLIFYALLAKNSPKLSTHKTVSGEMVYVQAETADELTLGYSPTEEEISQLEKLIVAVWGKIMNLDFPDASLYDPSIQGINQFIDDLLDGSI